MPAWSDSRRIGEIQWLRAVAALMVVAAHIKIALDLRYYGLTFEQSPVSPFPFVAGVDVFFVISGFVMAHSSRSLHGRGGAWRTFLVRRLARVAPLYWLMTALLIVLLEVMRVPIWAETTPTQIVASFLFLPVANPDGVPLPLLDIGWSLNYEMLFYAVFALFVGWRQRVALGGVALVLVVGVLAGRWFPPSSLALRFWSDPIVLEFLLGIAIYGLVYRGFRLSDAARWVVGLGGLALFFAFPQIDFTWRFLQWGVPAGLMVLAAVSGHRDTRSSLAEWAGNTSYAIYLSHFFVIRALLFGLEHLGIREPIIWLVGFPLAVLIGTLAVSTVLHYGFERPVLRWVRRRFDRNVTEGVGAPAAP
ncbi:acyltransferase family protein [Aureimonas ureilytica]|uniref:acyltransferase family protein n=1 Tax=Aureimonas ureilytica TaxID=401562 RepID=UPI003CF86CC2